MCPAGGSVRRSSILTENPGKAKVAEFDDLLFGDENVFRFDVSMDALKKKTRENGIMARKTPDTGDADSKIKQRVCVFWTRTPC